LAGAALQAGLAYAGFVFVAGFALGAFRVGVVEPATGALAAVAIELPVILTVSWLACGAVLRRLPVPPRAQPRLLMGAAALAILLAAEILLAALAFGRGITDWTAALARPAGALGLAGQVIFALFPWARLHLAARP
jgi:hypothetical protein